MALHETIERIRSSPVPPNEVTARLQILAPILQDRGWNPFGPEILWEHASHDPAQVRPKRLKQTPSGLWVDIKLNAQDVRKRALRLLKALGHDESDLVYLYE